MATLFDYLDWRGDLSFSQSGVCEVDNLIFSHICYLDFEGLIPNNFTKGIMYLTAMKRYKQIHKGENNSLGLIFPPEVITLATKAARSERFGRIRVAGHVNVINNTTQMQFSATTFLLDDDTCFVAFRGSDDTLIAWKENFNMSFMSPVPAQVRAVEYLEEAAAAYPDRQIYVGGHSKGGNLAVFAASKCSKQTKERLVAVYSNDGPGFTRKFIKSADYQEMRDKIRTLVPQSSVIGMLLEHEEGYEVVNSTQTGLYQHNGLSWEVKGRSFVHLDSITDESRKIDRTLKLWLSEMSYEKRQRMTDTIYELLSSSTVKTLTDLNAEKLIVLKAWNTLNPEDKKLIKRLISLLVINTPKKKKDTQTDAKDQTNKNASKPKPRKELNRK
ncbi:MAG: DUF2974 domain-containing protein [Ruminococcaceae bacterium]|nr:DUF2974 domain-containing protein [Oscillospiraceae bacterium]